MLADALSRRPDYEVSAITQAECSVFDMIRGAYSDDERCSLIIKCLSTADDSVLASLSPRDRGRLHRFSSMDGLLYYQVHAVDEPRVVVPANEDLKYKLVYEVHDTPIAGHLGREKTYAALASHFWWPKMYSWVEKYLRTCDVCQRVKPSANSRAPLASLPVPADCWKSVSLDFVFGLPPDADGHNGVLVFVDRLSKMVHLAPAIDTVTAEQSAKLFIDCVFRHHGLPDTIVSDRDTRFTADLTIPRRTARPSAPTALSKTSFAAFVRLRRRRGATCYQWWSLPSTMQSMHRLALRHFISMVSAIQRFRFVSWGTNSILVWEGLGNPLPPSFRPLTSA